MLNLIEITPDATLWMDRMLGLHARGSVFGDVRPAVIWTDETGEDGELLVAIDPVALAASVNADPYPLLAGHDPGRPMGKVLAAEVFKSPSGATFVAAAIGFYSGAPKVGFRDLGVDPPASAPPPARLPALPDTFSLTLAADPREVEKVWMEELARDAPFPVQLDERSYNAAEAPHEFISIGLAYLALVWNPFSKAFIEAAGKDAYAAVHAWLRRMLQRMAEHRNPFLEIQSHQRGCVVSFMMRGRNVAQLYKAHDALADGAVRAAQLVANLGAVGAPIVRLVYEFDPAAGCWFPAFAELTDGRLVTDNADLIAAEKVPTGLSLGLSIRNLQ